MVSADFASIRLYGDFMVRAKRRFTTILVFPNAVKTNTRSGLSTLSTIVVIVRSDWYMTAVFLDRRHRSTTD